MAAPAWIDKWLAACHDLDELGRSHPMSDAVIEEIDGRMIRVGDKWLADFASCNYLGFDLEREIIEAVSRPASRLGRLAFSSGSRKTCTSRTSRAALPSLPEGVLTPVVRGLARTLKIEPHPADGG